MKSITTPLYWDCECQKDYIHSKTQNECLECGTSAEEQPDSIIEEVDKYLSTQLN